ncbi:Mobile element protein [Chitinispirillum alkaliphilum]|nr:Mobile element protein [Chitinispirillum alkaliphilum]
MKLLFFYGSLLYVCIFYNRLAMYYLSYFLSCSHALVLSYPRASLLTERSQMSKPTNNHTLQLPIIDLKKLLPQDLAKVNEYYRILKTILISKLPKRISLNDHERHQLALAALEIKNCIGQKSFFSLDLLFSPETLLKWYRKMKAKASTYNNTSKKPGRPPVPDETVNLALKLANDNTWGYERISAELKKLGHDICPNTVKAILSKNGIAPSPDRNKLSWKKFIMSHLEVTWACDYFTEKVLTPAGFMTCYVLFFIHLGTRRIHFAGCSYNPDYKWVAQQGRNFSMFLGENPEYKCKYLIHDRDTNFIALDHVLEKDKIKIKKASVRSPWQNGYAERVVRECREVLDYMIILGQYHLIHVMRKIEKHHNFQRPHQGIENCVPMGFEYPDSPGTIDHIECEEMLGGMLKHYYVKQAA